ncbi:hypothetical protein DL98DRAFT_579819 [Cadophora sp. DSE1049]|nr:hypothetical protein DL98DRAFT_579819 [Cadophora sp. DSE1049]
MAASTFLRTAKKAFKLLKPVTLNDERRLHKVQQLREAVSYLTSDENMPSTMSPSYSQIIHDYKHKIGEFLEQLAEFEEHLLELREELRNTSSALLDDWTAFLNIQIAHGGVVMLHIGRLDPIAFEVLAHYRTTSIFVILGVSAIMPSRSKEEAIAKVLLRDKESYHPTSYMESFRRKKRDNAEKSWNLETSLLMLRNQEATDDRDKIFTFQSLHHSGAALKKPDYSMPTIGLYTWMSRWLYKRTLNALLAVEPDQPGSEELVGLPPWAIGFNLPQTS